MSCSVTLRAVHRHAALIELTAVTKHIFTHFTEVDIQITTVLIGIRLLVGINKGVKQPKLYILNIGRLEVAGIELAHHSAPMLLRILQGSVIIEIRVEVIRTALIRIIGKV